MGFIASAGGHKRIMAYFDDIQFINCAVMPGCNAVMDQAFPSSWSIEFFLSGKMFYGVDSGPQVIIDKPAVFWHSPEHNYQYGAVDQDGWYHHYVQFRGRRGRRLIEEGLDQLSTNGIIFVRQGQTFADMFRMLVSLIQEGRPRNQAKSVLLLERIYSMLLDEQYHAPELVHGTRLDGIARQLEVYSMADYDFNKEAKKIGLSYSRFRALFKKQLGFAPHDYLLLCRMRHAARLLEKPGSQVKQVAYECGFNDPAQFSRLFKKKIGMSPKSYQNSIPR